MVKGVYEKSLKTAPRPKKKGDVEESYVQGARQTKVEKPKSLTPKVKK